MRSSKVLYDVGELLGYMTEDERQFIGNVMDDVGLIWSPLPGPQTLAYESEADIIGFGGAAGGGKTDLAIGKALTQHKVSMMLRREATQLTGIIDRMTGVLGSRQGYNGAEKIWRFDDRQVEFGSVPHLGDETKYQGRPHDLLVFDEAANFLESQVRFLLGWLRSTDPDQHCQALFTFNPPTTSEGRWIIDFFGPWLKRNHPNPAKPGELRWFYTVDEKDYEAPDNVPFILASEDPEDRDYDFDPDRVEPHDIIKPMSRTFIPSRVTDNPYLYGTGYMRTLQALPEPLRSQMLLGDFHAGMGEDPWQVIPTAWVEAAMARWVARPDKKPEMSSLGIDVARGGKDETVIQPRHEWWYAMPVGYPGTETPDGPKTAGLVVSATRDGAVQHIEINGVGAAPFDFLNESGQQVIGVDVSEATEAKDKSGHLKFKNVRSWMWWAMREELDPANGKDIALPPHDKLKADLTAPKWQLKGKRIEVESREDIVKRTGRSPDYGTACCLARMDTPKKKEIEAMMPKRRERNDPYMHGVHNGSSGGYNPYDNLN